MDASISRALFERRARAQLPCGWTRRAVLWHQARPPEGPPLAAALRPRLLGTRRVVRGILYGSGGSDDSDVAVLVRRESRFSALPVHLDPRDLAAVPL